MHRVPLEIRVVLLFFETLGMCLAVFGRRVSRWRFALFARFCALERDDFLFAFFSHGKPFATRSRADL